MGLNVKLVQESFAAIKPYADEVMEHFYTELFKRYPAAKGLFQQVDMKKQRLTLAKGLSYIVENLGDLDHLGEHLRKIGARYEGYGVKPEHYGWVGETLLATLAYYLDEHWTDELKEQWTIVYTLGAEKMQEGALGLQVPAGNLASFAKLEPGLREMVKSLATELFVAALAENKESFFQIARSEAQTLLKKALEMEVQAVYSSVAHDKKVEPAA